MITLEDVQRAFDQVFEAEPRPFPMMLCRPCDSRVSFELALPANRYPGTVRCPKCRREMERAANERDG